jgi:N-acetylglucosaminyldiphosphoundecaprenol N-acetyl-beta-D-mannosaminyltransferase
VFAFVWRLIDVLFALVFMLFFLLPWCVLLVLAIFMQGARLEGLRVLGRKQHPLKLLQFRFQKGLGAWPPIKYSPYLWPIFTGRLSLVGPTPLSATDAAELKPEHAVRFDVKPGVVNSFFIKKSVNIDYIPEPELTLNDLQRDGFKHRFGLLLRALPALVFRAEEQPTGEWQDLTMFGLTMKNLSMDEATDFLLQVMDEKQPRRLAFVNPACINIAMKDQSYRKILEDSDWIFPDGIGIQVACKMLGKRMKANLNGTDLFPALADAMQGTSHGCYLFGAGHGVVDDMAANLRRDYPDLKISGYQHGFLTDEETEKVIERINASGASILLVAMGVPLQEKWIERYWGRLNVPLVMGVGGLFDFMSGRMPRAPEWMRELGLEWLFRLLQEPRRMWRRYVIGNVVFLWNVMRYGK